MQNRIPTTVPVPLPGATQVTPTVSGWEILAPGLERRTYFPRGENFPVQILVLRVDPTLYTFRAHYQAGNPLGVREWMRALPGASALVNANFFDISDQILGLLVSDSVVYGQSFYGRGGMFQVQNGQARVRSLIIEPYAGEVLEQAVQAFPMLVIDGVQAYTDTRADRPSRRTIVAQDRSGRILLMVTPTFAGLTLFDLSAYLPATDMDILTALNLDGGGSTMMASRTQPEVLVGSFDPVPAVLAVYPR